LDALDVLRRLDLGDHSAMAALGVGARTRTVAPDPRRRPVARAEHVLEHFRTRGSPVGHGFAHPDDSGGRVWYAFDHGAIRCVVLDTVNEHGGWQGSIGADQLAWLIGELVAAADRSSSCSATIRWSRWSMPAARRGRPGESSGRSCASCSWPTGASPSG
jgi:hypothetical protein